MSQTYRTIMAAIAVCLLMGALAPVAGSQGVMAYRFYTVHSGDTLSAIAHAFGVPLQAMVASNDLKNPNLLQPGEQLVVPLGIGASGAGAVEGSRKPVVASASNGRSLQAASWPLPIIPAFAWPVQGFITSRFGPRWGRMHDGVDIAAPMGAPIRAAAPGVVVTAGWEKGYGRVVVLRHSFGLETVYGHASKLLVRVGEVVAMGQVLGRVGESGDATGPHLHFEVRFDGQPRKPLPLIAQADGVDPGRSPATASR